MIAVKITNKKTYLALVLILAGAFLGTLAIFVNALTGGLEAITWLMVTIAVASVITGSILAFSQLLDHIFQPVVDELSIDIEDDIQALKQGIITDTHLMVLVVGVVAVLFSFFVFRFHKLEATWGGIPVSLVTILAVGLATVYILHTNWFRYYKNYTPLWVFAIPAVGILITTLMGITKTEDPQIFCWNNPKPIQYNMDLPVDFFFLDLGNSSGVSGFDFGLPSCSSDDCGVFYLVLLVIALIVFTIVLIIGSACIPHFWLLSGCLLLAIMALIAYHDLRLRPGQKTNMKKTKIGNLLSWPSDNQ